MLGDRLTLLPVSHHWIGQACEQLPYNRHQPGARGSVATERRLLLLGRVLLPHIMVASYGYKAPALKNSHWGWWSTSSLRFVLDYDHQHSSISDFRRSSTIARAHTSPSHLFIEVQFLCGTVALRSTSQSAPYTSQACLPTRSTSPSQTPNAR